MSATFTASEILQATGGAARGELGERFVGVSTDSRATGAGALFVALKGESFDGHAFVAAAAKAGASSAVVERGAAVQAPQGFGLVEVEDTRVALGQLARFHRRRFSLPLGAVTGSNGKTTTKEMIGAILATRGPALKTEGNLNNEVGVPRVLLELNAAHTAAIIEMGMNHPGELARLTSWAEPQAALITCVAPAHLLGLKTLEAVAAAKGEIFRGLPQDGLAIANADDMRALAQAKASGRRVRTFGKSSGADVRLARVRSHDARGLEIAVAVEGREHRFRLAFLGEHNAVNACGAIAMGLALGCTAEQCVQGLAQARPWAHRLALLEAAGGFSILDDCYNANPSSMVAALDALAALAGRRRRVAVLGDMLELGASEAALHRQVGEHAAKVGLSALVAFGPRSAALFEAARGLGVQGLHVADPERADEATSFLQKTLAAGDLVLVKGSRGMKLERVVALLMGKGTAPGGGGH